MTGRARAIAAVPAFCQRAKGVGRPVSSLVARVGALRYVWSMGLLMLLPMLLLGRLAGRGLLRLLGIALLLRLIRP